ncbi:PEP-CTERM protein-sorting domain-containing protein [Sphingomonas laterariae]|uniref:PEP-CTERM protein-sorting domain-containing protein n=1 Tax=Edaphosphingomonas laterariae TaxID=861865 RepID=A0A239E7T1_9SPHN|nr:nidogen-like domain-containing protein [Sphingomonas laterariae]SNS40706.1 PEP-CTERM protein-sorting domain-containing protein [Sphingomonas laterariae]
MRLKHLVLGTALAFLSAQASIAAPIASGFDSGSLGACDDCFSNAHALGFSANFFGTTYSDIYISNNGYLTFGSGQGDYTPDGLGAAYAGLPIIAAFFGDVDTRGAGSALATFGTGTYAGRAAFGATWDGVGYYDSATDKLNNFQIVLTDRSDTGAGNFDIYLNYAQIQWETGNADDGQGGLGGFSASAGFNAGTGGQPGTFFEIPGSRTPGSFVDGGTAPLINATNNGTPGQFLFTVRNGVVAPAVPEPATWAMMIAGFGLVGGAMRRRPRVNVSFAA